MRAQEGREESKMKEGERGEGGGLKGKNVSHLLENKKKTNSSSNNNGPSCRKLSFINNCRVTLFPVVK